MGYQLESLVTAEGLEYWCENTLVFCSTQLKYTSSEGSDMQPLVTVSTVIGHCPNTSGD